MAAAMENLLTDEVMKRRLLVDGDGVGDDRKILGLMKSYVKFCTSTKDTPPEELLTTQRRLISSLHQISMSIARTQEAIWVNEETREMFVELGSSLRVEVDQTKGHIVECKHLLEDATKHRKHAMEYDALAKLIHSQPDRKATQNKKATLTADLNSLKLKETTLANKLEARRQNVSVLAGTIERLKQLVDDEVEVPPAASAETKDEEKPMEIDTPTTSSAKTPAPNEPTPMELDKPGKVSSTKTKSDKYHEDLSEDEGEAA